MPHSHGANKPAETRPDDDSAPLVDDIHEAVNRLALRDVIFLKLEAERLVESDEVPETVSRRHQLLARQTERVLHARVDSQIQSPEARFRLNALAVYEKQTEFFVSEDVQKDFLERVGVFAIWPYLRAQLHQLCDGLSVERVPLPMIRQGQVTLAAATVNQGDSDDDEA